MALVTSRWLRAARTLAFAGVLSGCAHGPPAPDRTTVYANLATRTGLPQGVPNSCALPYGMTFDDEIGENEAVLAALWNNAAFQEALADLGIARGDLIQAGLLPNPELVWLFSVPDKPFRYAVDLPLEALWLRPIRVKAASDEANRVADRLTQTGLDLMRDTRQAFADSLLARGRLRVGQDSVKLRGDLGRLAAERLKAGDISVQEAATAQIDADLAQLEYARLQYDVGIADVRLRQLMGLDPTAPPLKLDVAPPPARFERGVDDLIREAIVSRPDALAAEQNVAAAAERLRLTRLVWFRLLGIADATSGIRTGHEFGPGGRMTIPILNWNQGNIAKARAELEKAERGRKTVHDQIVADVAAAHLRYAQGRDNLRLLEDRVRPEAEKAIGRADAAYREGATPYVVVLETTRQVIDTRLRREQLFAEMRRAWADLERGVGRRLSGDVFPTPPAMLPAPPPVAPLVAPPAPPLPPVAPIAAPVALPVTLEFQEERR